MAGVSISPADCAEGCVRARHLGLLIEQLRVALAERPPHSEGEIALLLRASGGGFMSSREALVDAVRLGATAAMLRAAADVIEHSPDCGSHNMLPCDCGRASPP